MYQYRFISCNKCVKSPWWEIVIMGKLCMAFGRKKVYRKSLPFSQFSCEPKTALTHSVFLKTSFSYSLAFQMSVFKTDLRFSCLLQSVSLLFIVESLERKIKLRSPLNLQLEIKVDFFLAHSF